MCILSICPVSISPHEVPHLHIWRDWVGFTPEVPGHRVCGKSSWRKKTKQKQTNNNCLSGG